MPQLNMPEKLPVIWGTLIAECLDAVEPVAASKCPESAFCCTTLASYSRKRGVSKCCPDALCLSKVWTMRILQPLEIMIVAGVWRSKTCKPPRFSMLAF
jgi:hypothetical protein